MKRTTYCGHIRPEHIGQTVTLCGWVHSRRDHGGVIFIDIRDREGLAQVVFQPEQAELFSRAERLRSEFVIAVSGPVRRRPAGTENPLMPTGQVEVVCAVLDVINTAPALPFEINDRVDVSEETRLRYRFLDLRRPAVQKNFMMRHRVSQEIRHALCDEGFIEVETPCLTKSTPEGARDFLVPARLSPGNFYALPQSPQLFKQILMVSGFDRYFQIVRCFRDEDLRADRQPEFTQVDLEMSFVDENDVMAVIEKLLGRVFKAALGRDIPAAFPRMNYDDAMLRYGSDKPDTRFGMEIADLSAPLAGCGFKVFAEAVKKGGAVRGLCIPGGAAFSRSEIDGLTAFVAEYGARGLAWMKATEAGFESNIVKFFSPEDLSAIRAGLSVKPGDLAVFLADEPAIVAAGLGALRLKMGRQLKLIDAAAFNFLWVVDFPLFEWDREEKRWSAMHHPFTAPRADQIALMDAPAGAGAIRARAYDVVLNGVELGGGSIRIHAEEVQRKLFALINIGDEEARAKFGFLLDALSFGAPPHGGIALGLDRLCALLAGEDSIREVIAFPKTQKGSCPLSGAPSAVPERAWKEMHIRPAAPPRPGPVS